MQEFLFKLKFILHLQVCGIHETPYGQYTMECESKTVSFVYYNIFFVVMLPHTFFFYYGIVYVIVFVTSCVYTKALETHTSFNSEKIRSIMKEKSNGPCL